MKECTCERWKANIDELNAMFSIAAIHGFPYQGEFMDYCPWCSERLRTMRAPDSGGEHANKYRLVEHDRITPKF